MGGSKRSLRDLMARSELAFTKGWFQTSGDLSPTVAHRTVLSSTADEELARSCRFAAILHRDYGQEVFELVFELMTLKKGADKMAQQGEREHPDVFDRMRVLVREECGASVHLTSVLRDHDEASLTMPARENQAHALHCGSFLKVVWVAGGRLHLKTVSVPMHVAVHVPAPGDPDYYDDRQPGH